MLCRIYRRKNWPVLPPWSSKDDDHDQGLGWPLPGFVWHRDLPPGFHFSPTDGELIVHYLRHRATTAAPGPAPSVIPDLDIIKLEPWDIPNKARLGEQQKWYFFSQQARKYAAIGSRTNRATISGYWKATGKNKEITSLSAAADDKTMLLGFRRTLVFYKGRAPNGTMTSWVMHEYRLGRDILQSSTKLKVGGSSSSTASTKSSTMRLLLHR